MALKVRFLKRHMKWQEGDTAVLDNTKAAYLDRMKVAEIVNKTTPEEIDNTLLAHLEPEKKVKTPAADKPKTLPTKTAAKKTAKKK